MSHLWVLLCMIPMIISPSSCSGAYANTQVLETNIILNPSLTNHGPHTVTLPFNFSITRTLIYCPPARALPQLSRRNPECRSKAPSTHASNCHQKANVPMVRMDLLRRGTCHISPT